MPPRPIRFRMRKCAMRSTVPAANPSPSRAGRRRTQEDVGRVARHDVDLRGEGQEYAVAADLAHDDAHVRELREVQAEEAAEELVRDVAARRNAAGGYI